MTRLCGASSRFAGIRDRSVAVLATRERKRRGLASRGCASETRAPRPQGRPPSAGPRASAQPVPPPAAGEGALNVDLRACGGMKEWREFRRFCSRNWRGPSGPLIVRRLHVWEIAQKSLFAKSSVAWLASMAMVGCGGVRSACDASGECRSASRSSEWAAGPG